MRGGILFAVHHGLTEAMIDHIHSSFKLFADQVAVTNTGLSYI